MTAVANDKGIFFLLDTHVQFDPTRRADLAEATLQATYRLKLFGITPKIALLSHSNFGSHDNAQRRKMRKRARAAARAQPTLEVEGEMHADAALSRGHPPAHVPEFAR